MRQREGQHGLTYLLAKYSAIALVLTATLTSANSEEEEVFDYLKGIRYRNETTFDRLSHVSMAGGLEFFIDGAGFDELANINTILFESIQEADLRLAAPPMDIDDEIQSAPSNGKLAYTVPSLSDLFGGMPQEAFSNHFLKNNGDENIKFQIKIQNNADNTFMPCENGNLELCRVFYSVRYTPLLFDISPSNVYLDQEITLYINPMASNQNHVMKADADPVDFIKFSGTRNDFEGLFDAGKRLNSYRVDDLRSRSGDQLPGNSVPEVRFRTGNALLRDSAKHCNFAGDDCWYVKTHPKIDSISASSGYTTGGQELTITGWGLKATSLDDVTVTVDGVACTVTSSATEEIKCVTGAADAISLDAVSQPGQPGLIQTRKEVSNWNSFMTANGDYEVRETNYMTAFENHKDDFHYDGIQMGGWFKAPATGRYKFYVACDDWCEVQIDAANPFNAAAPADNVMETVADRYGSTEWRHYFQPTDRENGKRHASEWIDLAEGEFYKIDGFMMEWGGGDHFTVSVEFEQADSSGHHHARKEIQVLAINTDQTYEKFEIDVQGATGEGSYKVQFINPLYNPDDDDSVQFWASDNINDNASADTVRNAIQGYFQKIWGSNIYVDQVKYDVDDAETTDDALTVKSIYTVTLRKLINGPSFTTAVILAEAQDATIGISMQIQDSAPPLSGKYKITCPDENGTLFTTRELNYDHWSEGTDFYVNLEIPHLQYKVWVRNYFEYDYRQNGLKLAFIFQDFHGDVPECYFESSEENPILGKDVTFTTETIQEYGVNLMWEPIPLEFIYTDAQQPQVLVSVNGIDAVCPEQNCNYIYVDPVGTIMTQDLTDGVLTIDGTSLPTEEVNVRVSNSVCEDVVASADQITCNLNVGAAAGTWDVQVTDANGLAFLDTNLVKIDVPLTVTSVDPSTGLNQLGGDILTLTGTGFDQFTTSTIVTFSDATMCLVQTTSDTELTCMVDGFDPATLDSVNPYTMSVSVNGVVDETQSVAILATKQSGHTVSPTNISPILRQVLTVTLEETYPDELRVEDFSATLVSQDDPTVTRTLYVMSVDNDAKTIQIKFPGADSGNYFVQVYSETIGRIDKTPLALEVYTKVTGVSQQTGSRLGGALLTIDGVNFSDDKYDNPVKVGDHYCLVQETSVNQITCRIMETFQNLPSSEEIIVFLAASEEAQSDVDMSFEYEDPIEAIVGVVEAFDPDTNSHKITLEGRNMPESDITAISLYIDGVKQETLSTSAIYAEFKLTDVANEFTNDFMVYFTAGLGVNYDDQKSQTFTPTLVSISPSTGSSGGTLITVTGTAFGVDTSDLNLVALSTGETICDTVTATGYGEFSCLTKAVEISADETLRLRTGSGDYDCGNVLDSTACKYEQLNASSPTVTQVTLSSASQVDIVGTGFPTDGSEAVLIIQGVESDLAVINDATSITVTFDNGVPVLTSAVAPSLRFIPATPERRRRLIALSNSEEQLIAFQDAISITNSLTVSASTSSLSCSFQGGCAYSITADGLTSTLASDETSYIDVCGQRCTLDTGSSSASEAICTLPYVSTAFSASEYEIVKQGTLHEGTWTGTASDEELVKLTDNKNAVDLQDTDAACYVQIEYKENHVGVLDEAKFFINNLTDKTPFVGSFVFQGSDDGVTFDDLWTVDQSVHEGWNSHDFDEVQPSYHFYRFQGSQVGSCRIGEVRLHGVESIDDDQSSYKCTPKLYLQGELSDASLNTVVFDSAYTPVLTGMSSRFGSVLGGEEVSFYGTNFSASALTSVMIDERECTVDAGQATDSTIVCVTSDKPYRPDEPSLVITVEGMGYVATKGQVFRYVSRWSDSQTWNYDLSPQEGEAVNIPKGLHLLFDIDSSPVLSFIVVEGSLIFPPNNDDASHHRTFDAHYILVRGGYLEVGTEDYRYTSKMTITMHSSKYDPNLPIFGNKVIGVNYGTLEMHGIERPVTWTDMFTTAEIGATEITLNTVTGDPLDWQVGEEIVIASTDFSGRNAEQRTIASITNTDTNPVITFTEPLIHKHYAGVQYFGTAQEDWIEMRAEVGLLTRNVKYQGDETSTDAQYGAVIIMHSPGDETTAARIDNVELFRVGQAFILGSYPIHFHMIGTVHSSYIRNNAIHHSFNRAVTIHGVHYLRVQNNVAYHTMGHTIFIEDAAETKNLIENNLIVDVRRSWSLLNTDQTPASIWITNPDNIIRGNHAAGSDRYSYWYDTQKTAIGPSFDENICPENTKLGEFRDNVAHSNGRYGLRIFHNLIPREHPCEPMVYDPTDPANPYPANPPIIAEFHNLVSYKNKRNGAIAERVGAVQFHNFKTADNLLAGMEFSLTEDIIDGYAKIVGGFVVGRTENTSQELDNAKPHGVITPRTENFSIEGLKFYNYNWNDAAGFGTCSHCFHPAATDSGARTIRVSNLFFDESVTKRIRYQYPERAIFFDETGGLTDLGPGTWAVPDWPHLRQPECTVDLDKMGGIICDNTVQVRRIAFFGYAPDHFWGMEMKIAPYDQELIAEKKADGTLEEYLDSEDNYTLMIFKKALKPDNGWAVPYVTNHKYRVHWRRGLDFDRMQFELSERWEPTDGNIFFNMNFTETREAVNFTTKFGEDGGVQIHNETLRQSTSLLETGDNWILNDTETREIMFVVNGKNPEKSQILMEGLRCISGKCVLDEVVDAPLEEGQRLWSDVENWGGVLPAEGEDVEIPSGWNMVLDLEETPIFKSLTINGRLTFYNNDFDIHLRSKQIFVRSGEFLIGTEEEPFRANALITLHGMQDEETLVLSGTVSAGNKILATVGDIYFYGLTRDHSTRLMRTVYSGDTELIVDEGLDWVEGDEIWIAPTAMQYHHSDYRTIVSYEGNKIVLDEPLKWYHWGAAASTEDDYDGIDMRGEVYLLTRNIKIRGEDADGWGGQVLVTDYFEPDGTWRKGQLIFDNVQVYNCSQEDTYKAAIRWEGALGGNSKIANSVVHGGLGWGISVYKSNNVILTDSAFIGSRPIGIHTDFVRNFTMTNNMIGDVMPRKFGAGDGLTDKEACVALCSYHIDGGSPCIDITVQNNLAVGCKFAGFIAPGYDCDGKGSDRFKDNISHSNKGVGAAIYPDGHVGKNHRTCYQLSHFKSYKTELPCVATHYPTADMRAHHMTCIDSEKGINLQTGMAGDNLKISLKDSIIFGETQADDCPNVATCQCHDKMGLMFFGNNVGRKDLHIAKKSARPIYKIKSFASFGGEVFVENVTFKNFKTNGRTQCASHLSVFGRNPYSSDKIPMHKFKNCRFEDVDDASVAWFEDPAPQWAIIKDCGAFPCTAPNNILASFTGTRYTGVTPIRADADFQIIPDDPNIGGLVGGAFASCEERPFWQGYHCRDRSLSYIVFESQDDDKFDRSIQPIFIVNEESGFNNTLNSMMDHVWDGFYTGQTRMSRFPGILSTDRDFTIDISGTPPKKMRFKLYADQGGTKIKIPYPVAGSVRVLVDRQPIDYTPWSKELNRASPLTKSFCGENRFVGIENFLEFYMTPGCEVWIEPRDAIMTKVRMEWSLDEFYSNGGVTRFVDRLAASLGINANRVKTVAVYEGSTVVESKILSDENESAEEAAASLAAITEKLVTQVNEGTIDLGAPILGIQGNDGEVLAGDPIPDPVIESTGRTVVTVETVETSAIIRDGPNLWDGLEDTAPPEPEVTETEETQVEEPQPTQEEPTTPSAPTVETTPSTPTVETTPETSTPINIDPLVDMTEVPFDLTNTGSDPTEQPREEESTQQSSQERPEQEVKFVTVTVEVYEEEQVTPFEILDTDVSNSETNSASKFLIVIPAIVVAVLVFVAISIIVKVCNKKRTAPIIVKMNADDTVGPNMHEDQVQYVMAMDGDEKSNIFARPTSKGAPGSQQRQRVKHGKVKGQQDELAGASYSMANLNSLRVSAREDEVDDGFGVNSFNSSKKFDLSSKSYQPEKSPIDDTIRPSSNGIMSAGDPLPGTSRE